MATIGRIGLPSKNHPSSMMPNLSMLMRAVVSIELCLSQHCNCASSKGLQAGPRPVCNHYFIPLMYILPFIIDIQNISSGCVCKLISSQSGYGLKSCRYTWPKPFIQFSNSVKVEIKNQNVLRDKYLFTVFFIRTNNHSIKNSQI